MTVIIFSFAIFLPPGRSKSAVLEEACSNVAENSKFLFSYFSICLMWFGQKSNNGFEKQLLECFRRNVIFSVHDSKEIMLSGLHFYGSCSDEEPWLIVPSEIDCWVVTSDTEWDGSVQEREHGGS